MADRPYGKFYDFYSVSLETFGSTYVLLLWLKSDKSYRLFLKAYVCFDIWLLLVSVIERDCSF